jgi:peptidoglycan/LPS O-acetylase OafA/YrhL
MGLTWAAAWFILGLVPRWLFGFDTDAPLPLAFGVLGFIAGLTFSGLLVLTERRRRFDEMSLWRFAAWGALGGFLLSVVFAVAAFAGRNAVLVIAPTFAIACAICAAGSLALARRPVKGDSASPRSLGSRLGGVDGGVSQHGIDHGP